MSARLRLRFRPQAWNMSSASFRSVLCAKEWLRGPQETVNHVARINLPTVMTLDSGLGRRSGVRPRRQLRPGRSAQEAVIRIVRVNIESGDRITRVVAKKGRCLGRNLCLRPERRRWRWRRPDRARSREPHCLSQCSTNWCELVKIVSAS
jgi:hypothetical protein